VGEGQQAGKVWRIGMLMLTARPEPTSQHWYNAFLSELRELGYREGDNIVIEWRHTGGVPDRTRSEAISLMEWRPDIVVTPGVGSAVILRDIGVKAPIVVAAAGDLVGMGLAASLARPGGNITGLQILSPDLMGKRLELIKEMVPRLKRLAVLIPASSQPASKEYFQRILSDVQSRAGGSKCCRFTPPPLKTLSQLSLR
jgi:putative ABC transport system substrate-binding protein